MEVLWRGGRDGGKIERLEGRGGGRDGGEAERKGRKEGSPIIHGCCSWILIIFDVIYSCRQRGIVV